VTLATVPGSGTETRAENHDSSALHLIPLPTTQKKITELPKLVQDCMGGKYGCPSVARHHHPVQRGKVLVGKFTWKDEERRALKPPTSLVPSVSSSRACS